MVNKMATTATDLTQRTCQLEERIADPRSSISIDSLLDSVLAVIYDSEGLKKTKYFDAFYSKFYGSTRDIREKRINCDDFEPIKIIGRGAFGTVDLVRQKSSGQVFAMKTLSKFEMLKRSDSAFFWEERNIMAFSNSDWIVKLHYAFQDAKNLYMIMDYMIGGDLITLLERYDISESSARFYCAEIVLGLDAIHTMGYIHRDIKPDNILIDARGHLKLADFGTCVKMDKDGLVRSDTAVGTPDYISPEILKSQTTTGVYGREVDWWSVGVLLYEMLLGETPFYAESLVGTYHKIMNHRENLVFPDDIPLSGEARALMCALLCDRSTRLGKNGVVEIKAHPFFTHQNEWTWETLRKASVPVVTPITNDEDVSNFNEIENNDGHIEESFSVAKTFVGNQLSFIGFSFSNEQQPFLERRSTNNFNHLNNSELEQRLQESERTKTDIENRLRRLYDDFNQKCQEEKSLNKKLYDLERKNGVLSTETKEAQRKYELELDNRRTCERNLAEIERSLESERQAKTRMNVTSREWTEKMTNLDRQVNESNDKLQIELDGNLRLKKQNQELQKSFSHLERAHQEVQEKYQELIAHKLQIEKDFLVQQSIVEQEKNAKFMALEKIQQLEEKNNSLTTELSKYKDRDTSQTNELADFRQSSSVFEREKLNLQVEIDSLRAKLSDEETAHQKLQEQLLVGQLQRLGSKEGITYQSEQIIKDLESKLDSERLGLKKSNDDLINAQKKVRILEIDVKEITANYNQLLGDYQFFKESNEQIREQIQFDHQRLSRSDHDLKQLQQQLNHALNEEKQLHKQLTQAQRENERLNEEMRYINQEYKSIRSKVTDYEEQVEVESQFSVLYRTQMTELKDEITELTEKFRKAIQNQTAMEEERRSLTTQLDMANQKLKSDSSNLNRLQEKCAELEKDKSIVEIELGAMRKDFNSRLNLLDSEINTFRDRYEKGQSDREQAIKDREAMSTKLKDALERQIPDLRRKADEERAKKEAAVNKIQELATNPMVKNLFYTRPTNNTRLRDRERNERNGVRRLEQALEVERAKYKKLQNEKDDEVSGLTEDISRLKRDILTQREEIERFKQQIECRNSSNSMSTIVENVNDDTNDHLQSWVQIPKKSNIQKNGWKKQFAVLFRNKFVLYNSEKDQHAAITIDFDQLYHVRAVNQGDVLHVDPKIIPKIFQIIYDSQNSATRNLVSTAPTSSHDQDRFAGETIEYGGHSFIAVSYRKRAECEVCNHPCYNFISPPPCLECTRCHVRCHKQHYDDREFIQPCRVYDALTVKLLLVMCTTENEQKRWIGKLSEKIPRPTTSQNDSTRGNTRTSPRVPKKSSTLPANATSTRLHSTLFCSSNSSIHSSASSLFDNVLVQQPKRKSSLLSTRAK